MKVAVIAGSGMASLGDANNWIEADTPYGKALLSKARFLAHATRFCDATVWRSTCRHI